MPETMRYVWEAVLGIWTILSCILLQHEWQQNKRLRHLARTEKTNANLYLEKWMTAHKEKMAVDSELAATKMALEMEQKNMSTTQEHMKFYIDSCRDLEKMLKESKETDLSKRWVQQIQALEKAIERRNYENRNLREALGKSKEELVDRLGELRDSYYKADAGYYEAYRRLVDIEAALAQAKEELVKLQADYDNLQEFNEVTCAGPQPFGQQSAAFDPKIPNEVYTTHNTKQAGE